MPIHKYQRVTTPGPDGTTLYFRNTETHEAIELAELNGWHYVFVPDGAAMPEQHADIVFGKIDTEVERELAQAAGISSIPTLMVFREQIMLFQQAGALPANGLEQLIGQVRSVDMDEVRRQIEAAGATREAAELGYDAVALSLSGQTTQTYFSLRSIDAQRSARSESWA